MKKIRLLRRCLLSACLLLLTFATASAQTQRVTVSASSATVGDVIQSLKQQTGLDFFFSNAQVDVGRRVALDLRDVELDTAVRRLLGADFTPEYDGNVVIIRPAVRQDTPSVTGRVTDTNGNPIVGASIWVTGNSNRGTISDIEGNFALSLTGLDDPTIVVTFIGMEPVEFAGTAGRHDIVLRESVNQIGGVTVSVSTGYQDIPRDRMTGSYTTVNSYELQQSNFMSLDQALSGKVAGLYAMTPSGQPGVRSELRIRGDNSISGSKEPLWVVDGLPLQEGVATINGLTSGDLQQSILSHGVGNIAPADIESVTILKDAAATAIYGARAAAGVIVVKTKRGTPGGISVNYQGNFAIGRAPTPQLDFMNAAEKVAFEIELAEQFQNTSALGTAAKVWNDRQRGEIGDEEYRRTIADMSAVDVDWFDEIYRTSFSHNHNLSLSGGTEKMSFYGSVGALDEKGILKSNRFNTFSATLKVGYQPNEKFSLDFSLDGSYRESNNHNSAVDPFKYAVFANPYEKAYNDDGSRAYDNTWLGNTASALHEGAKYNTFNILDELENTGDRSVASDITATLALNYRFSPWLRAEAYARVGYATSLTERWADRGTYSSYVDYILMGAFSPSGNASVSELPAEYNRGYMSGSTGRSPSYSMRAGLSFDRDIDSRHFFNAYIGTELRSAESWSNSFRTAEYDAFYQFTGFPEFGWKPDLDPGMSGSLSRMARYVYGNKDRYASFFGTFTYSYEDRYVLNANARLDGAGTIHADNRFTPLWSASVRWNLHRESFIKDNLPWLSEFAVRAVYGYTGQIDKTALPFAWLQLASQSYDGEYYAATTHFPNPGIKWEKKQERSIGVDYALFNNVFGGSVNYYNNKTRDLLDNTRVADSFGNVSPRINKGSLTNSGFEFNFNLRLMLGEVRWLTSFNISRNTNRITDTYLRAPNDYEDMGGNWMGYAGAVEGYAVGTTFGYRFAGVNPETGNAMIYLSDAARRRLSAEKKDGGLGMAWEDTEKWDTEREIPELGFDGAAFRNFLAMSLTDIGNSQPKYYGGFGTTVQWRDLELRAAFSYATGRVLPTFDERNFSGGSELNVSRLNRLRIEANRWRAPGDVTSIPRYTTSDLNYAVMFTSDRYEDADYLSFNDLSLNYNLGDRLQGLAGIKSMRVGLQVQNLATWSRYSGFDATSGGPFSYPRQRRFLLNLQLSF